MKIKRTSTGEKFCHTQYEIEDNDVCLYTFIIRTTNPAKKGCFFHSEFGDRGSVFRNKHLGFFDEARRSSAVVY